MTENFVDALRRKLREHMNNLADDAAGGAPQDWASYKKLTGVIQGLAIAERELLDLAEKVKTQDDD